MRISFDIDDTLICLHSGALHEPNRVPWLIRRWLDEPLRLGSVRLIKRLVECGCRVGIYTTSLRSPGYIRAWLGFYGIRPAFVVNDRIHQSAVERHRLTERPSKYPPAFQIDLHVDDSEGVRMEGIAYGFSVVVIDPLDDRWEEKILAEVDRRLRG